MGRLRQRALPCYDLPAAAFSRHSELVASLALFLARAIGYRDPSVAYTAGLLHDVGKVALDELGQQVRWAEAPMNVAARRGMYPMEESAADESQTALVPSAGGATECTGTRERRTPSWLPPVVLIGLMLIVLAVAAGAVGLR